MYALVTRGDGRKTHYSLLLGAVSGRKFQMDFTGVMRQAVAEDRNRFHGGPEQAGPLASFELERARAYASYAVEYLTPDNFHKFNVVDRQGDEIKPRYEFLMEA